jgi:hypothetical protein
MWVSAAASVAMVAVTIVNVNITNSQLNEQRATNREQAQQIQDLENSEPAGGFTRVEGHDAHAQDLSVDHACVKIAGYAYHLPADGDIWIIVRVLSDGDPYYYPIKVPLDIEPSPEEKDAAQAAHNGSDAWQGYATLGTVEGKGTRFRVTLYYAISTLSTAISQQPAGRSPGGKAALPQGLKQLDTLDVVRRNGTEDINAEQCSPGNAQ